MRMIDGDALEKALEDTIVPHRLIAIIRRQPTIEVEPNKLREVIEPYREFCKWVAEWIFKEDFEESAGAFAELACRRLAELGYVFKDGEYWLTVDYKELEDDETD